LVGNLHHDERFLQRTQRRSAHLFKRDLRNPKVQGCAVGIEAKPRFRGIVFNSLSGEISCAMPSNAGIQLSCAALTGVVELALRCALARVMGKVCITLLTSSQEDPATTIWAKVIVVGPMELIVGFDKAFLVTNFCEAHPIPD
jgi:hypothetical protein